MEKTKAGQGSRSGAGPRRTFSKGAPAARGNRKLGFNRSAGGPKPNTRRGEGDSSTDKPRSFSRSNSPRPQGGKPGFGRRDGDRPSGSRAGGFNRDRNQGSSGKPYGKREFGQRTGTSRNGSSGEGRSFDRKPAYGKTGFGKDSQRRDGDSPRRRSSEQHGRPAGNRTGGKPGGRPFNKSRNFQQDGRPSGPRQQRAQEGSSRPGRNGRKSDKWLEKANTKKSQRTRMSAGEKERLSGFRPAKGGNWGDKPQNSPNYDFKKIGEMQKRHAPQEAQKRSEGIRLNKYIANSGVCSRREADVLIQEGHITVNNETITTLGYKVNGGDVVKYKGRTLRRERMVYVLLNKPKDFITTTDDPDNRRTVMDLVSSACDERIYPVGRLDRNTTGLLLLTNDGELAEKLAHPSHKIKKIYQVDLNEPITEEHVEQLKAGITLEDGPVELDDIQVISPDRTILGVEIHIGRNRIVRRIFEHLGYDVIRLDRVMYGGLTKKDLPRGHWRYLDEKEVIGLKFFKQA